MSKVIARITTQIKMYQSVESSFIQEMLSRAHPRDSHVPAVQWCLQTSIQKLRQMVARSLDETQEEPFFYLDDLLELFVEPWESLHHYAETVSLAVSRNLTKLHLALFKNAIEQQDITALEEEEEETSNSTTNS